MTERRSFEGKFHRYSKSKDGMVISFVIHPSDAMPWMATDDLGTQYMIAVQPISQDGGDETAPKEKTDGEKALAAASILAQDRDFQAWVYNILHDTDCISNLPKYTEEEWKLVSMRMEIARAYIKEHLGIETMKDIRDDEVIRANYYLLYGKFKDSQCQ